MSNQINAYLMHWGENFARGWLPDGIDAQKALGLRTPAKRTKIDETVWRQLTDRLVSSACNTVVIDLSEAVVYPSHPELAVEGSWSPDKVRAELARLRALGLEPVPMINFSATHDAWLKDYHRMVSTPTYYRVCSDVIRDVAEIFGSPRYIHIGYDEETAGRQRGQGLVICRQGELWWHDFLWFVERVERTGARPWCWSDRGWHHEDFISRCPKSVLLSDWYYDEHACGFDLNAEDEYTRRCLQLYLELDKAGFDQVPCGSNWNSPGRAAKGLQTNDSFLRLVEFCRRNIAPERLKGFLMTSWELWGTEGFPARTLAGIELSSQVYRDVRR